jgi:hypothetical protein
MPTRQIKLTARTTVSPSTTIAPAFTKKSVYDASVQHLFIEGANLTPIPPVILTRGEPGSGRGLKRRLPFVGLEEEVLEVRNEV